jgi:short-subunit dehydrogenase
MPERYALITGASSGIGAEFARQLAAEGIHLALVARNEQRLQALRDELRSTYPVAVEILPADLGDDDGIAKVAAFIQALPRLDLLINNAGFGVVAMFAESDIERQISMVQVHVNATLRLCHAALPGMIAQHNGAIINVASVSAFAPTPHSPTYSASKAALVNFSRGLHSELRGTGVRVQALCPGFTHTHFHDGADFRGFRQEQLPDFMWASAEAVVRDSLHALRNGGPVVVVPGWINRLMVTFIQTPPGRFLLEAVSQ